LETLLLEYRPEAESAEIEGESGYSPDFFFTRDGELVRDCLQCGFSFVQRFREPLLCLCPNCRETKDECPNTEILPVRVFPSFISRLLAFDEI